MEKKGQSLIKFGMEVLVAAIVVLTFIAVAYSYGSGEVISKIRSAKDTGLMIEEMYLIPNEINTFVTYPENISKFDITINDNTIEVSSTGNDITKGIYKFASSANYPALNRIIKKPKALYIGKINGELIASDKKPDLRKLRCPEIKTKPEIKSILIDSGLDESSNIEKAKLANSIAFSLISKLNKDYQVEHARNENINNLMDNSLNFIDSITNEKISKADAVIQIKIGEKQDNSNNIKVYFSPNSSKKEEIIRLSCTLLNNLIGNGGLSEITGIAIIPKEHELILNNDKLSIIMEIGNYLDTKSLNMLNDIQTIETITSIMYHTIKNDEKTE